jgi:hypothetical protein
VAADTARKRELLEEFVKTGCIFTFVGVDFGIGSFQIAWSQNTWRSMPGPGEEDHVRRYFLISRFR